MAKVEHDSDGPCSGKHRHVQARYEKLIAAPRKMRRRRMAMTVSTEDCMRQIAILRE